MSAINAMGPLLATASRPLTTWPSPGAGILANGPAPAFPFPPEVAGLPPHECARR